MKDVVYNLRMYDTAKIRINSQKQNSLPVLFCISQNPYFYT
nr:MAG TPA: hypothetical protein [Caudoviricetes sp.]